MGDIPNMGLTMKDYIRAYPIGTAKPGYVNLVTEVFEKEADAKHFAEVFQHNYDDKITVPDKGEGEETIAFMNDVPLYLVRSNYREDIAAYEFANWIFVTRKKRK